MATTKGDKDDWTRDGGVWQVPLSVLLLGAYVVGLLAGDMLPAWTVAVVAAVGCVLWAFATRSGAGVLVMVCALGILSAPDDADLSPAVRLRQGRYAMGVHPAPTAAPSDEAGRRGVDASAAAGSAQSSAPTSGLVSEERVDGAADATSADTAGVRPTDAAAPEDAEGVDWRTRVKAWAMGRLERLGVSAADRSLAAGLLFGAKAQMSRSDKYAFRQAGMSHILAVSGLHVGVIWWLIGYLLLPLRLLPSVAWRARGSGGRVYLIEGEDVRLALLLVALWLYVALAGWPASGLRAGLMITLVTLGWFVGGRAELWHTLAVAALVLLIVEPAQLYRPGFQLSFLAVAGIMAYRPWTIDPRRSPWVRWLALTGAAQLFTMPVVAYRFHLVPVMGWLQGVAVVPMLPWYVVLLVAAILLPDVAWLAYPVAWGAEWMRCVARATAQMEEFCLGGHVEVWPEAWEAWLLMLAIVAGTVAVRLWRFREVDELQPDAQDDISAPAKHPGTTP